jgi:hypothetical protein
MRNRFLLLCDVPLVALACYGAFALRFDLIAPRHRPEFLPFLLLVLRSPRDGRRWGAMALAALVGGVALLGPSARHIGASTAWTVRSDMAVVTARMLQANPWFGVGIARFSEASTSFMPPSLRALYVRENAHNQFFQVAEVQHHAVLRVHIFCQRRADNRYHQFVGMPVDLPARAVVTQQRVRGLEPKNAAQSDLIHFRSALFQAPAAVRQHRTIPLPSGNSRSGYL